MTSYFILRTDNSEPQKLQRIPSFLSTQEEKEEF